MEKIIDGCVVYDIDNEHIVDSNNNILAVIRAYHLRDEFNKELLGDFIAQAINEKLMYEDYIV